MVVDAPFGSKIRKYYKKSLHNFLVILEENKGFKRQDTEKSMLCMPLADQEKISWKMAKLTGSKNFKSPIDLVSIHDSSDNIVLYIRYNDLYLWTSYKGDENERFINKRLKYYPDREILNYNVKSHKNKIELLLNKDVIVIPKDNQFYKLCIGLKRSQLKRYYGQYIPKMTIEILNIL